MKIYDLFEKKIDREISGVIKVQDTDALKAWTILDEYVVTTELEKLLNSFFSCYNSSLDRPTDDMGVWISGFFGSGKSHFLEILFHLLSNDAVLDASSKKEKKPLDFFKEKNLQSLLVADIGRAAAADTDTVIFNIDAKAEQKDGEFAVLNVFLRVFNALQGFYEKTPWIAELERRLTIDGVYDKFQKEFESTSGKTWLDNRDAILLHRNAVIKALSKSLPNSSETDASAWFDDLKNKYSSSPEEFAKLVKKYLDAKGPKARVVFLVDEVGQFIGERTDIMLKLQTITEELGIRCKGRAWVIVTSQEDIDKVLGNINQTRSNDFSKIQGRFKTRLSLSSANVDEVIKLRILKKTAAAAKTLASLYTDKEPIIKNLLSFSGDGTIMPTYKGADDFAATYPFVSYQFQLLQQVYTTIRRTGASGQHLAHGERSMINAFQSAARSSSAASVGMLVPFYAFYESIENSLEGSVKSTISRASEDKSLSGESDAKLLKLLFLLRNLDRETPPTIENLATLFVDHIDADKLKIKKDIEASLARLERQNFVRRNDDRYFFLSDQEQEIEREIQHTEVDSTRQAKKLFSLVFEDVFGVNKSTFNCKQPNRPFDITRRCDNYTADRQTGELSFSVVSPLYDTYSEFAQRPEWYSSQQEGTALLILAWDDAFDKEFSIWLKTEKFSELPRSSQTKEREGIITEIININSSRRDRLKRMLETILLDSRLYIGGREIKRQGVQTHRELYAQAAAYLIENTYNKLSLIRVSTEDFERELHLIITESDHSKFIQDNLPHKEATDIIKTYIISQHGKAPLLTELVERFERKPYGWKDEDIVLIVSRLFKRGDIELRTDAPLSAKEAFPHLQKRPSWKQLRVGTKQKVSAEILRNAQQVAKRWFNITPQGDENLFLEQLREQLEKLNSELLSEETTSIHKGYPGLNIIREGKAIVQALISAKESSHLLSGLNDRRAEIDKFIDAFEDVKDFYAHQKSNWDDLQHIIERAKLNEHYLAANQAAQEVLGKVQSILTADNPFSKLKDSFNLSKQFGEIETTLLAGFRNTAQSQIQENLAAVQAVLAEHGASVKKAAEEFLAPLHKLTEAVTQTNLLSAIELAGRKASELAANQARLIREAVEAANGKKPDSGNKQNTTQNIRMAALQPLGKPLSNADEVNSFIDKAHSTLLEAVKKGPVFIE